MISYQIPNAELHISTGVGDEISRLFQSAIEMLMDFAPSDSACQAKLVEEKGAYRVQVGIRSAEKNFLSQKSDANAENLFESLKKDLLSQFSIWRDDRALAL